MRHLALILAAILMLLLGLGAEAQQGKKLYERYCDQCHGPEGKGDGPAAPFVYPKPRDLTRGLYKIRSSESGKLPSDADLLKVIVEGVPGTSMPGWPWLAEGEKRELVQYVKAFSPRFAAEPPAKAIPLAKRAPVSKESLEKGKQLYQDLECFKCHGQQGRADGPSAPELEDDWGNPLRPSDLSRQWLFRGGSRSEDIYIRFMSGMAGTPMPSYVDSIEPGQAWQLTHYVKSLGTDKPGYGTLLVARYVKGALPEGPDDPAWQKLTGVNFPLVGQVINDPRLFSPAVDMVSVKALYNEKELALWLAWHDPNQSLPDGQGKVFADAIAVQFPTRIPEGAERPFFLMGDDNNAVYLLRWDSASQKMTELNARGAQKQTAQPAQSQQLPGKITYSQGRYELVIRRPLTTEDKENDLQFVPGKYIPVAFMAWDGSNGETGAKMSLSSWYYFLLEAPPSRKPFFYPPLAALVAVGLELAILRRARRKG